MYSAALSLATSPDTGSPKWEGLSFVARARVSAADNRTTFSVFAIKGWGQVSFDMGDGTVHTYEVGPDLLGDVVDGRRTPIFTHQYANDGDYLIKATGTITGLSLTGHLPNPDSGFAETVLDTEFNTFDSTSALHDILYMPFSPTPNDMSGWGSIDTAIIDGDRLAYDYPKFRIDPDTGVIESLDGSSPGPRKVIAARATAWDLNSIDSCGFAPFAKPALEEFYAPCLTTFGEYVFAPFGVSNNLRVVYIPKVTSIPGPGFVSPLAEGVAIYAGKLTGIAPDAFIYEEQFGYGPNLEPPLGQATVELFCLNTSTEIRAFNGYPFGAFYLKCHCTDLTFDTEDRYWRNSDGKRIDPGTMQLIDEEGRLINEDGQFIALNQLTGNYELCDEYGHIFGPDGRPYDPATGFWLNKYGHICDEQGRDCDVFGRLTAFDEETQQYTIIDENGTVLQTLAMFTGEDPDDPRHGLFEEHITPSEDGVTVRYFSHFTGYMEYVLRDSLCRVLYAYPRNITIVGG